MADDEWEACPFQKLSLKERPGATPSSSTSLSTAGAIAVAAVEHDRAIDPALTAALENPRERAQVLKWEDQILQFMRAGSKQLDFPPLSSYHRLIIHRLAQRFQLDHTAIEPAGSYLDPNANRAIVLIKAPQSCIPRILLIDTCSGSSNNGSDSPLASEGPARAPVLLMRRRSNDGAGAASSAPSPTDKQGKGAKGGGKGAAGSSASSSQSVTQQAQEPQAPQPTKSVTEREREYAEARARIFGTSSTPEPASGSGSTPTSGASPNRTGEGAGGGCGGSGKGALRTAQAQGPDGTQGFGGGRGRAGAAASGIAGGLQEQGSRQPQQPQQHQQPSRRQEEPVEERRGGGGSGRSRRGGGNKPAVVNPGDWVESKALLRDREAERYDPDFRRGPRGYGRGGPQPVMYGAGGQVPVQVPPGYPMMDPAAMAAAGYMGYAPPPPYHPPATASRGVGTLATGPSYGGGYYPPQQQQQGGYGYGGPRGGGGRGAYHHGAPPPPPGRSSSGGDEYNAAFPPLG